MPPTTPRSETIATRALWYDGRGGLSIRDGAAAGPGEGEAVVRTLFSGVSRGTERLVLEGRVPESEWRRMRAPRQDGGFPGPVKYGYAAVGMVEEGPANLLGCFVFCLNPHETAFVAPAEALCALPDGLSPKRAVLAANMETALNAVWDSGADDHCVDQRPQPMEMIDPARPIDEVRGAGDGRDPPVERLAELRHHDRSRARHRKQHAAERVVLERPRRDAHGAHG